MNIYILTVKSETPFMIPSKKNLSKDLYYVRAESENRALELLRQEGIQSEVLSVELGQKDVKDYLGNDLSETVALLD